jgi:predicted PurR-regulated permease PerM
VLLNVPQALVLGLLTVLVSVFPLFGSGLVWFPVSIGLLLAGRDGTALGVVAVGLVVSVADNLVRPYLASRADLRLNGFVVLVAMLGGSVTFGAFGLLLGPLLARLGVEAASIYEEERMLAQVPAGGS